jgi:hypothetical protein
MRSTTFSPRGRGFAAGEDDAADSDLIHAADRFPYHRKSVMIWRDGDWVGVTFES